MSFFNQYGRRVPRESDRVFGKNPSFYYRLEQPDNNYIEILERSRKQGIAPAALDADKFEERAEQLLEILRADLNYANLLKGVRIPFVYQDENALDLGTDLEETLLPSIQETFKTKFPDSHFKAVLQSNSKLPEHISIDPRSKYQNFVELSRRGGVVGWFFPEATQEFDVESQRAQMAALPMLQGAEICLSGGKDICAALIGSPDLLVSSDYYTPILCMSAYVHSDPRLVLLMKAYGPHMEFWCMTQMLTKDTTQVSEQWSGGLSVFMAL